MRRAEIHGEKMAQYAQIYEQERLTLNPKSELEIVHEDNKTMQLQSTFSKPSEIEDLSITDPTIATVDANKDNVGNVT